MSKRRLGPARLSLIIIAAVLVLLVSSAGFYTDVLWFNQLGYSSVFFNTLRAQVSMFFVGFFVFAVVTGLSGFIAYKTRPIYAKSAGDNEALAQLREAFRQFGKLALWIIPVVLGIFGGLASVNNWKDALLFLNGVDSGKTDPQFHLDVSFYLFKLAFLHEAFGYLSIVLFVSAVGAALVQLMTGGLKFNGRSLQFTRAARVQVSVTAALFMITESVTLWLDQYNTMTSPSGLYTGATYSDVNASIPGLQIMAGIGLFVAVLFLVNAILGRWRIPVMGTALMIVSALILNGLYPWIVQQFQVVPNERTLEATYIERNIQATLDAYGLTGIKNINYEAKTTATSGALRKDAETTASIRIIDPYVVSASFKQLEQYKQYYGFNTRLDVDRYTIDGKVRDAVVATRELNQSGLGDSQSWYNNVIVYTHGYGLVAAYGNQRSIDGQPVFFQSGIPSDGALGKFEPRIYFGESNPEYSIVGATANSKAREMDYPGGANGAEQTYTTFTGNGGPKLDNIFTRLAYAVKFQSEQILLSDAISDKSQILYNRTPIERVQAAAPYLTLDSDTYPSVVNGRVVWIVDGYTTSNRYPYSRAESFDNAIRDSSGEYTSGNPDVNYIRNSVKATVDAYDGSVKLYAWDSKDPVLQTWQKIYPNTVLPISKMSGELMSHVRYPADLFKVQRAILGQYHVTEAGAFYSQQDAWMTPNDPVSSSGDLQPPYYLSMKVPGADASAFSLYTTFIPRSTGESSRNVLTAYLAVDSDAGSTAGKISADYGTMRLLSIPRTSIVPGPGQVQNSFSVDPDVSKLLNLLRQGSTTVLDGNLLTLPVGGGLLYVQPVYIQSTGGTSFPLLKKVLVAFGDKIAFEDTLDAALNSLFGGNSGVDNSGSGTGGTTKPGKIDNVALQSALKAAQQALSDRAAALKVGDWTAYGEAEKALQAAIEAAVQATK